MLNLRFKWVGRWLPAERQFRFFRVMWEGYEITDDSIWLYSIKISVSIKNWLPRVTWRRIRGGFV